MFLTTNDNKDYITVEKFIMAIKPIEEENLIPLDDILNNEDKGLLLGEATGKLHQSLSELDDSLCDEVYLFDTINNWAMPAVEKLENSWTNLIEKSFYDDYLGNFEGLSSKLVRMVIHRNLHLDSFFVRDGNVTGFGDFYLTQKDVRLFDPCYLAISILAGSFDDLSKRELWFDTLKNIIKGYSKRQNVTKEEYESIIYVLYSIQMIFIAYFGEQNGLKDLAEKNYRILAWLYENKNRISFK